MPVDVRMALQPLIDLATCGLQPRDNQVWIGIGFLPPKRIAVALYPHCLPPRSHFKAVTGLDAIVTYHGAEIEDDALSRICGYLHESKPRRLMTVDIDANKIAILVAP